MSLAQLHVVVDPGSSVAGKIGRNSNLYRESTRCRLLAPLYSDTGKIVCFRTPPFIRVLTRLHSDYQKPKLALKKIPGYPSCFPRGQLNSLHTLLGTVDAFICDQQAESVTFLARTWSREILLNMAYSAAGHECGSGRVRALRGDTRRHTGAHRGLGRAARSGRRSGPKRSTDRRSAGRCGTRAAVAPPSSACTWTWRPRRA